MWFSAEGAMMLLGIDSNSHPHGVEDWSKAIAVMIAGLLGGAVGVAVGMIPWVAAMSRVLPPKTFRKWADSSAVMRAYLDAVVRIFGASSSQP